MTYTTYEDLSNCIRRSIHQLTGKPVFCYETGQMLIK
jgi:hypothetical protein